MINKIISGGQTGADRGGLEAAKILGIATGGFCPKGFLTENGADISLKDFGLIELETSDFESRTIKNVVSADGTVIFGNTDENGNLLSPGSSLTFKTSLEFNKPVILNPDCDEFINWLKSNDISILNVAGDRESANPGIYKKVKGFLIEIFTDIP